MQGFLASRRDREGATDRDLDLGFAASAIDDDFVAVASLQDRIVKIAHVSACRTRDLTGVARRPHARLTSSHLFFECSVQYVPDCTDGNPSDIRFAWNLDADPIFEIAASNHEAEPSVR